MNRIFRIRVFSVLFISIFSAMLGLGIILPILPLYAKTIGATGLWLGAIFAGFSISRSVMMPFIGRYSDKSGIRKTFIATGLIIYALSSLGYIYSTDAFALVCVRVVQGACSAMIVPIAMAYIGDITPREREGSYMGLFTISLFLGFGIGPLFGGLIMDLFSVDTAFMTMGVLCLIAFCLVMVQLPSSKSKHLPEAVSPSSYRKILSSPLIRGVVCYRFVSAFARASILSFLPLYASYRINMTPSQIGIVISSSVLLTSFFQYPFGRLADRVNRRNLILIGSIPYSLAVMLFPFADSFLQVLVINLLVGVLGAMCIPAASAIIIGEGKRFGMGSTMAVFNVSMSLGLGCGPLVSGIIHDFIGLNEVFYFASFVGVAGTILAGYYLTAPLPQVRAKEVQVVEDI